MHNKVCLVTGANSGVGKEIAMGLARLGAQLVMVCRDTVKGEAAQKEIVALTGNDNIKLHIADLSSQQAVRALAGQIEAEYPKLHVLINNAGVVLTQKTLSIDAIEMTLATNYLGPFLLTNLLLDKLKSSAPARIINVSSMAYKFGGFNLNDLQFEKRKYSVIKSYGQSKILMNSFSFELARRLGGIGVTVNCLHPGAVKTNLGSNNASNVLLKLTDRVIKLFFISPKKAAETPLYLATSDEVRETSGKFYVKCKPRKSSHLTTDPALAQKIWNLSERLVGI